MTWPQRGSHRCAHAQPEVGVPTVSEGVLTGNDVIPMAKKKEIKKEKLKKNPHVLENQVITDISNVVVWNNIRKCFVASCIRKPSNNWYFKHCGLKKSVKMFFMTSCTRKTTNNWYFKRCGLKKQGKKYRKMFYNVMY